jgi:hypothetical protein
MPEHDYLDKSVPAALDDDFKAPWFDWLTEQWPERDTARGCLAAVHRMDVERAMQPPVVNVTVPGIPGHFTGTLGGGEVAYLPDPALTGAFTALPDSLA